MNLKKKHLFIVKNIVYIISKENHYEVDSIQILILLVNDNSHNFKMEDVNMKKVLTVLMLVPLLVGCSKELEIHDSISEEDQVVYHPLPVAKYKDGYYIQNNNTLYYIEENKNTLINYCYFRDDQFSEGNHGTYKRYDSYIIAEMGFYVLDDAIYTLASYMNVEGETWDSFVQMSLDGKELKELFKLDFQPYSNFTIHNNKVYMIEDTSHKTIHILSLSGKELKSIKDTYADSFFISENKIYLRNAESGHFSYLDENDEIINLPVKDNEYIEMINNDHVSSISYEDNTFNTLFSHYRSLTDTKDIHIFTNELVTYFDDQYIYTSQLSGMQKYRIYDLDANLIKEIIPSQSIQIEENNILSINGVTDFSVICRVIDNKIIAYNYTGPIECNTDTGQCKYTVQ